MKMEKAFHKTKRKPFSGSPNLPNRVIHMHRIVLVGCIQKARASSKIINRLFIGTPNLPSKVMRLGNLALLGYITTEKASYKIINRQFIGTPNLPSKALQMRRFFLGLSYATGEGIPQDWKKAHMWVNLAIHNGYSDEQKARDTMAKKLSSQDLIEAQEMAKRCLDSGYKDC